MDNRGHADRTVAVYNFVDMASARNEYLLATTDSMNRRTTLVFGGFQVHHQASNFSSRALRFATVFCLRHKLLLRKRQHSTLVGFRPAISMPVSIFTRNIQTNMLTPHPTPHVLAIFILVRGFLVQKVFSIYQESPNCCH